MPKVCCYLDGLCAAGDDDAAGGAGSERPLGAAQGPWRRAGQRRTVSQREHRSIFLVKWGTQLIDVSSFVLLSKSVIQKSRKMQVKGYTLATLFVGHPRQMVVWDVMQCK